MGVNRVEIKDFLVFKGEFTAEFCPGINVFIGGNGTGKTTLLKAMYIGYKGCFADKDADELVDEYFGARTPFEPGNIDITPDETAYNAKFNTPGDIFIPEKDVLSHSKGFISLYQDRELAFDGTFANILLKAQLPVTRLIKPNAEKVLDKIKNVIGGEVLYENDMFFTVKDNGEKIPFYLEASGYRKFGLLWKLLRNGLLEPGAVLFWDEPENSLNPALIPVLVDILLELSRNSVQIFLATHGEILASYFAVNRQKGDEVMFYSLYKEGEQINYDSSDRFDLLIPNNLMTEPVRLYEKQIERGLGGNE